MIQKSSDALGWKCYAVAMQSLMLPEAVSIKGAELAGDVQEGLLAMAVGTGLQVMAAIMSVDVEAVCGTTSIWGTLSRPREKVSLLRPSTDL